MSANMNKEASMPSVEPRVIYADGEIEILSIDLPGPGGAHHEYIIQKTATPGKVPATLGRITFKKGATHEGTNLGVTEQGLIAVLIDRYKCFQKGEYSCHENALTLTKLEEAKHWQDHRTADRENREVEGKDIK